MDRHIAIAAFVAALSTASVVAEESAVGDETGRASYSLGYELGGDFRQQEMRIDPALLLRGIEDALNNRPPAISPREMHAALMDLRRRLVAGEQQRREREASRNLSEGRRFLEENGGRAGVVTHKSGLQYKVLAEGKGERPTLASAVTVNYRGTFIDGTEFDSSQRNGGPVTIKLAEALPGWREALPLMKKGSRWQIVLPPGLAYDDRGPLANRTLLFDVELIEVD